MVDGMRAEAAQGPAPTTSPQLTPSQDAVLRELMAWGGERPAFDPLLSVRLRDLMERDLAPVSCRLGRQELVVTKRDLSNVLQCERRWLAERDQFAWTLRTASPGGYSMGGRSSGKGSGLGR